MEKIIVDGLFTILGIFIGSILLAKLKRSWFRDDKDETREEEAGKERIISDRMIAESMAQKVDRTAERMWEKVERQEILIGQLRDILAAKEAELAVLRLKVEMYEKRGDKISVE